MKYQILGTFSKMPKKKKKFEIHFSAKLMIIFLDWGGFGT